MRERGKGIEAGQLDKDIKAATEHSVIQQVVDILVFDAAVVSATT